MRFTSKWLAAFYMLLVYFFTLNIFRKIGANILGDFTSTIFIKSSYI